MVWPYQNNTPTNSLSISEGDKSRSMILRYLRYCKWGDNEKGPASQIYFLIYFFETKLDLASCRHSFKFFV